MDSWGKLEASYQAIFAALASAPLDDRAHWRCHAGSSDIRPSQAQLPDDRRQMPLDEMIRLQPATADSLAALNHSKRSCEQRIRLICGIQPKVGSDQDRNP